MDGWRKPLVAEQSDKPKETSTGTSAILYNVVVGVYSNKQNAQEFLKQVQKNYPDAFIKTTKKSG